MMADDPSQGQRGRVPNGLNRGRCVVEDTPSAQKPAQMRRCRRRRKRSSCSLLLVILAHQHLESIPRAQAAGWWGGRGAGRAGQRGAFGSRGSDGDDMDEAFRKLEKMQFWAKVEDVGFQAMEGEVAEKKRTQISVDVAKACSVGTQMTLIMGGGALLFRLLPILLGHKVEDNDEEAEANSPYLLESGVEDRSEALPASPHRPSITSAGEEGVSTAGVGVGVGVQGGAGDGQEVGESRILVAAGAGGELVEGGGADVEVVPFTKRRDAMRRARRLARPYLKAMAPPLALLLVARLVLGDLLAKRIDPTVELLFGDDIMDTFAEKVDVPDDDDVMPFAQDSEDVPGRTRMKGKRVQRTPRPEGEEDKIEDGGALDSL